MALGFLKVAGSLVKGVSSFIKKRKEKKEEKIEKKVQKAVAKAEKQKATLAGLLGASAAGAAPASAEAALNELSLPSLGFNASDIFKMSAGENAGINAQATSVARGNTTVAPGQVEAATKMDLPWWLIPVAVVVVLFLFLKGKR